MKIITNISSKGLPRDYMLASIDTEWTKNYKVKNGNKPFNFSIIFFKDSDDVEDVIREKYKFKFFSAYIDEQSEVVDLINLLNKHLDPSRVKKLVGHQVISDLYTFVNFSKVLEGVNVENIKTWISYFDERKTNNRIFDTRFDIKDRLKGESRKLVDVCYEMRLRNQEDRFKQPELNKSMTALQNEFMQTHDMRIREKLSVMNLRHNLSSVLVYLLYQTNTFLDGFVNTNRILRENLLDYFDYVGSNSFGKLCDL